MPWVGSWEAAMATFEIEDIQRLKVQPGDVLLVTIPAGSSQSESERVKYTFETFLPVRAVVKTADIQVEVVSGEASQ